MSLLSNWKRTRQGVNGCPHKGVCRSHPDHLPPIHLFQAHKLRGLMEQCGGISAAPNAIAHKSYILSYAHEYTHPRKDDPPSNLSPAAQTLEDSYKIATLIYLRKRLQQIYDADGKCHGPRTVLRDIHQSHTQHLFSPLKEECARYIKNLTDIIDQSPAIDPKDIHLSRISLLFIFDGNSDKKAIAPAMSA